MNLFTKQKQTHKHRKQTFDYQRGNGGGINQEWRINRQIPQYIKQIKNKVLLYSRGNSTQYSVKIHMEKEFGKEWVYLYV